MEEAMKRLLEIGIEHEVMGLDGECETKWDGKIVFRISAPENNEVEEEWNPEKCVKEYKREIEEVYRTMFPLPFFMPEIKVFWKVRKGETWTEQDALRIIETYNERLNAAGEYKEIE